ncbi:folylpolyglutamate synthase/dihydrofolate synthase family protein [Massilibacteroides sp.]|uniref:bifunctional folylpolyglutamate synthase/dihydrofolate synthase n=1 Tax=Massilibacteroides sp. TaxID=2034766 RepID=UPI002636CD0A|nr:folylpolyglutamate synthase/dihydrofolate synthase family protein [Massilibacteroides sp.]MDD4514526.1 bifunctional folylpolyglutamate synthase/dihydrofolate synthase [Massilibacteroides sp.]
MTYEETLHYLYTSTPVFQHVGANAYKPGLGTSIALDKHFSHPHRAYKTIHVAGTNGKGSTSHLLAAILQASGYKTGLYTSPHLVDFRERIRVNGKMIPQEYVIQFVEKHGSFFEALHPSFFELTSTLAFDYFRTERVDFAIIEVGLGGRLDSTNIITPELSIITNISLDHTQFLGNTLEAIAFEKAGIIKSEVPVVIGERGTEEVKNVFLSKAASENAPIYLAEEEDLLQESILKENGHWSYQSTDFGEIEGELGGAVQSHNTKTVLSAVRQLIRSGFSISDEAVKKGFAEVVEMTGLMGRWQVMQENPLVVCDTGHNIGGWEYLSPQLQEKQKQYKQLRLIVGMVNDKDINGVLSLMPQNAIYYFTQPSVERAMPVDTFAETAKQHGLTGTSYSTVREAVKAAFSDADSDDLIFIGGSSFIVADAIPLFDHSNNLINN